MHEHVVYFYFQTVHFFLCFAPLMALLGFFIQRWVFHTQFSITYHLMPCPGFELTSENWTSSRDLNSGRSTNWATAAAEMYEQVNERSYDRYVNEQSWNENRSFSAQTEKPKASEQSKPFLEFFLRLTLIHAFVLKARSLAKRMVLASA